MPLITQMSADDYRRIFAAVEAKLIEVASQTLTVDRVRKTLNESKKLEGRTFSDDECYSKLVVVTFYSGFRAETVTDRMPAIRKHFPDYETVAAYGESDIQAILRDKSILRHEQKIRSSVGNATVVQEMVGTYGSFHAYIDSFAPHSSFRNLLLLREDLQSRFKYLGDVTSFHFMTDLGLRVLKPDRVICRIFKRLGLIRSTDLILKTVVEGRAFACATGYPIRYIDKVFVAYGQESSEGLGIQKGICVKNSPDCAICGVQDYCDYYRERSA
ncbi:MAG: DNA-3-methyladenine glycosylase I [bacterium]